MFKEDVVILEGKDSGGMDLLSEYSKDYNPSDFTVSDNIQKSAKILIVEDNDEDSEIARQIFSPIYEVCLLLTVRQVSTGCCRESGYNSQ